MPFPINSTLGTLAGILQGGPGGGPAGFGPTASAGLQGYLRGAPIDAEAQRRAQLQQSMGQISGKMTPQVVKAAWQGQAAPIASQYGVSMPYLHQIAQKESGNRNIGQQVNDTGSAFGPFQFTKGTWDTVAKRHPELNLTPQDRFDPAAQGRAIVAFTKDNSEALQNGLGRLPSTAELTLAHRFGAGGALALLRAKPKQAVREILPDAAAANPQWANLTAEQIVADAGKGTQSSADTEEGPAPTPRGGLLGSAPSGLNPGALSALLGGSPPQAPQPYGAGLANMTPEMREIMQIALSDPTLGPQALGVLFDIAKPQGGGAASQAKLPDKITELLLSGVDPQSEQGRAYLFGGGESSMETSATKNAQAMGYKPGTPEFNEYVRISTTKPAVEVKLPGAAPVNKALDERFNATLAAGQEARTKLNQLDQVDLALQNLPTGKTAGMIANVGAYLKQFGLDPTQIGLPDTASRAQVFDALVKPLILELRNPAGGAGMPGAMSDKDREFLSKSAVSLENTPEANAGILLLQRRLQQRNIELEQLAISHMENNNGIVAPSFLREVQEYGRTHPLFDEEFKKQYATLVAPKAAPAGPTLVPPGTPASSGGDASQVAPAGPPTITDQKSYDALPSGTTYQSGGKLYRKP